MPGPVSRTDTQNEPSFASALIATSPVSVNLMALPTRLIRTCVKRRPSPRPRGQLRCYLDFEREPFVGCQRLQRAANRLGNVLNGIIGQFELELASLDLGEVEHVIDQSQQMSAVSLKALENTQHLLRWFTTCAICHQLGIAQDGIERRAQFVAHIGKKLRFVLASDFELSAL